MNTFFLRMYDAILRTGPFQTATTRFRRLSCRVRNCVNNFSIRIVFDEFLYQKISGEMVGVVNSQPMPIFKMQKRSSECNIRSWTYCEICNGDKRTLYEHSTTETSCKNFQLISIYYNKVWCTFYHLNTFYHDYVLWNGVHVIKSRNTVPGKLLRIYACIRCT